MDAVDRLLELLKAATSEFFDERWVERLFLIVIENLEYRRLTVDPIVLRKAELLPVMRKTDEQSARRCQSDGKKTVARNKDEHSSIRHSRHHHRRLSKKLIERSPLKKSRRFFDALSCPDKDIDQPSMQRKEHCAIVPSHSRCGVAEKPPKSPITPTAPKPNKGGQVVTTKENSRLEPHVLDVPSVRNQLHENWEMQMKKKTRFQWRKP